jgi:hypothetical protein
MFVSSCNIVAREVVKMCSFWSIVYVSSLYKSLKVQMTGEDHVYVACIMGKICSYVLCS